MSYYFRLQELITVTSAQNQPVWQAVDIGGYRSVILMKRTAMATTSGSLRLQHAAVLDEASFVDVGIGNFDLSVAGNAVYMHVDLLRYVRWSVPTITGAGAQFLIDAVAKEN